MAVKTQSSAAAMAAFLARGGEVQKVKAGESALEGKSHADYLREMGFQLEARAEARGER
jgi:hypothetical protein